MQTKVTSRISTPTKTNQYKPSRWWLLLFVLVFGLFLLIQTPVAWIFAKVFSAQSVATNVAGNLIEGSADISVLSPLNAQPITGNLQWKLSPLSLLKLGIGADIGFTGLGSHLQAKVFSRGTGLFEVSDLTGVADSSLLNGITPLEWSAGQIHMKQVGVAYSAKRYLQEASGNMDWRGSYVGIPVNGGKQRLPLDVLRIGLSSDDTGAKLLAQNGKDQTMFTLDISQSGMAKVAITQRAMLLLPSYQGSAASDSIVITAEQPVFAAQSSRDK